MLSGDYKFMKRFWLEEDQCTGCAACANICPKNAITMKEDIYGFAYPYISDSCIDCDLCEKTCNKLVNTCNDNSKKPQTYAVWSKNEEVRFKSTSGGAFTELATVILKQGGCVVGAQYAENNEVEHVLIENLKDLEKIRQSKYTQSQIGFVFKEVKEKLLKNRIVGFCGAPCQVAGLYAYLGKEYDNLYTFDFICRGVNSPKAYRAWLKELEIKNDSKVSNVWFKYKEDGWNNSPRCTKIDLKNGKSIILKEKENLYMTGYLGPNLYIRPCCGDCEFKGVPRKGDLTLADFWGLDKELDDDKGTSLLLINNQRGNTLFQMAAKKLTIHERNFDEILAGNICFDSSVNINKQSKKFLKALSNESFSKLIKQYMRVPAYKKIIYKIIYIIRKACKKYNV